MSSAWLMAVPDETDPPSPPEVAAVLYDRAGEVVGRHVCPLWLRHEPIDMAWIVVPVSIVGLGLPDGVGRFYWALLLAVGVWAALRWQRICVALSNQRRQRVMAVLLRVGRELRDADPNLAVQVVRAQYWSREVADCVVASAERHHRNQRNEQWR